MAFNIINFLNEGVPNVSAPRTHGLQLNTVLYILFLKCCVKIIFNFVFFITAHIKIAFRRSQSYQLPYPAPPNMPDKRNVAVDSH
jgi:hypothetical protein